MASGQYILDENGNPKPEPNLLRWAMWLEHSNQSKGKDNRIVQQDQISEHVRVSTVFLGLDHNYRNAGKKRPVEPPVLWETMIFGGEHDQYMQRYSSRENAIAGHKLAVEIVKKLDRDLTELEHILAISGGWEKK